MVLVIITTNDFLFTWHHTLQDKQFTEILDS